MTADPSLIYDLVPEIVRIVDTTKNDEIELSAESSVLSVLRRELVHRIEALLEHQRELLMSILYRIDVDEQLVVEAFRTLSDSDLAIRLADLVLERQVQKARSRRAYRNENP